MNDENYRLEKLNFVSNLNGTTIDRILNILTLVPLVYFFSILIKIQFILVIYSWKKTLKIGFWFSFLSDFCFNLAPLVFLCTIFEKWSEYSIYALIFLSFVIYLPALKYQNAIKSNTKLSDEIIANILKLSIGSFRVMLYVFTAISILAVDFNVFPRYLAKTEKYGISIMDLGVGMYIAVHSMKIIRNDKLDLSNSLVSRLLNEFKSSSIIMLIGCLRLFSIKSTNYVEHVSEYGVHWNFLFTIVVVKILACFLEPITKNSSLRTALLSAFISFYYQYFLTKKNFSQYLLTEKRDFNNLVDMNKEGIFSCIGYLGIYLAFRALCLRLNKIITKNNQNTPIDKALKCVFNLIVFDIMFWILLQYSSSNFQAVSRRLCNLSFILLTMFSGTFMLTLFFIIVLFVAKFWQRVNEQNLKLLILETFSFAKIVDSKFVGLMVFLISNLMTGIVNLNVKTIYVSDINALIILLIYIFLTFILSHFFYKLFISKSIKND